MLRGWLFVECGSMFGKKFVVNLFKSFHGFYLMSFLSSCGLNLFGSL